MSRQREARVAVYFDFDNIVITRYDQVHGALAFRREIRDGKLKDAEASARLKAAQVSVEAILDYAATFGPIGLSRAYADWSVPFSAGYRDQLVSRGIELVQLFPLSVRLKNGADIRLAVDAMEDMFRLQDITHVVIVAGDSDYVALVQKAKQLGRYVVGIGVTGGTSRSLIGSCDEYSDYAALLGDEDDDDVDEIEFEAPAELVQTGRTRRKPAAKAAAETEAGVETEAPVATSTPSRRPGPLLRKAMLLLNTKNDKEWQAASEVKNQMLRMDPSFQERALGFATFTDFMRSRANVVEIDDEGPIRVRLRAPSASA